MWKLSKRCKVVRNRIGFCAVDDAVVYFVEQVVGSTDTVRDASLDEASVIGTAITVVDNVLKDGAALVIHVALDHSGVTVLLEAATAGLENGEVEIGTRRAHHVHSADLGGDGVGNLDADRLCTVSVVESGERSVGDLGVDANTGVARVRMDWLGTHGA